MKTTSGRATTALGAAIAVIAVAAPLAGAHARPASILELDRGLAGGLGYLSSTDANAGGSQAAAILLGDGNTIAHASNLNGDLSSYDAIWVSYNTDSPLTSSEITILQGFLGAGKKVVMLGDKAGTDYATYNSALLSVVGGGYASMVPGTLSTTGNTLADSWDQNLTAGLTNVRFSGTGLMTDAGAPELLFDTLPDMTDSGVAGLFHTSGGGKALVVLDASWMVNNSKYGLYGYATAGQNDDFMHDISLWLDPPDVTAAAVPEPATLTAFAVGVLGLGLIRRRRARS